ncbi:MAG: isoprenylcysteine carboxylmethyltransferase family protein [Gemmatimonadetes bacterium]|nr:isoprenylcysteine carboxylmethyltransferase family protein [Gemmatimonadota bacterium]MCY3944550.1 isoprenylcysteine carboxylmethyltransferase family protein [Gemmatimonadota bacterium]
MNRRARRSSGDAALLECRGRFVRGLLGGVVARGFRFWGAWVLAICCLWLARPSGTSLVAGGSLIAIGLLIRAWAASLLQKDRELAVAGPYAHTRNPLYLGSLLMGLGGAVAAASPWLGVAFVAFFVRSYAPAIGRESAELTGLFGESYRSYRASVPALLPRVTPYRRRADLSGRNTTGPRRISPALYMRNREWEAALGAVAALAVLLLKSGG